MVLSMSRPVKHPKTGVYYFRKAVPGDLRAVLGKWEEKRSLGTKDPKEARERHAQVAAEVEREWSTRRAPAQELTFQQTVALAGEWYRELVADWQADPGRASHWKAMREDVVDAQLDVERHGEAHHWQRLEETIRPERFLMARSLKLAPSSHQRLLVEAGKALAQGAGVLERNADGDFRPDEDAQRFPAWKPADAQAGSPKPRATAGVKTSLLGLVDAWWTEAKPAGRTEKTLESYRATFKRFAAFLGHDDAQAVRAEDVSRFKLDRLASGTSAKTVKDGDIAGLKSVFRVAEANKVVASNPAADIKVIKPKTVRVRNKWFTEAEAAAVLGASDAHQGTAWEKPQTTAAKRWIPWLAAYTGARVGELAQLRKQDVREDGGLWIITITPEAGTVKDKEAREVVLHPHLKEKGFPAFVGRSKAGHLFFAAKDGEDTRGKWSATKNRLVEFVRETVSDPNVAPNHAWRHLFKHVGREAGIEDSVLDAICGHAPKSIGGSYGGVSLKAQAAAFQKFPRFIPTAPKKTDTPAG